MPTCSFINIKFLTYRINKDIIKSNKEEWNTGELNS